jgi:hypothetical protein
VQVSWEDDTMGVAEEAILWRMATQEFLGAAWAPCHISILLDDLADKGDWKSRQAEPLSHHVAPDTEKRPTPNDSTTERRDLACDDPVAMGTEYRSCEPLAVTHLAEEQPALSPKDDEQQLLKKKGLPFFADATWKPSWKPSCEELITRPPQLTMMEGLHNPHDATFKLTTPPKSDVEDDEETERKTKRSRRKKKKSPADFAALDIKSVLVAVFDEDEKVTFLPLPSDHCKEKKF